MKSNKNFQKSKKSIPFDSNREMKVKKGDATLNKKKHLKKEIFDEIDEFEDIDLYRNKEDILEDEEDSDY